MERITKMVEIEQDFYIASDGKEFENEDECTFYEDELIRSNILCYDSNMKKCDFEDAEWVVVRNEEDVDRICNTCGFNGWNCTGICENGIYNRDSSGWNDWHRVVFPASIKKFVEFYED